MSQISTTARERIRAQGFCGLNDTTYAQINCPLRLSPAICMVWAAVGTALASPTILWVLTPFATLGAILPGHPFDVLYNYGLRHLVGTPVLPRYGVRRRLACVFAATTVGTAAWAFQTGIPLLGYLLGGLLVALAFVQVSTGFCVPSFLMRVLFGKVVCVERERCAPHEPSERALDYDRMPMLVRSIKGYRLIRPKDDVRNAA